MNKSITFVIGALLTAALIVAVAAGVSTSDNNFTVQYNYFFGLNPSGSEVIATYGKLPELGDEEAKKRDVREVPVRFVLRDFPRLDILAADDGSNEDTPPSDDPSNKNISDSDKASSKSVPGFGLPGGLISLLGIWLFRRR